MVRIWYATNRKMNEKGEYTKNHDTKNTYGHMDIELGVAQHHSPPKKSMAGLKDVKRNENDFFNEIEECLDYYRDLGCTPQVLVALHNYNVGFKDSLVGAAHWHEDLNVPDRPFPTAGPRPASRETTSPIRRPLSEANPRFWTF